MNGRFSRSCYVGKHRILVLPRARPFGSRRDWRLHFHKHHGGTARQAGSGNTSRGAEGDWLDRTKSRGVVYVDEF